MLFLAHTDAVKVTSLNKFKQIDETYTLLALILLFTFKHTTEDYESKFSVWTYTSLLLDIPKSEFLLVYFICL